MLQLRQRGEPTTLKIIPVVCYPLLGMIYRYPGLETTDKTAIARELSCQFSTGMDRGLDVARWLKISPTEVLTNDLSEV